ncbi:hypothetical protein U1Q18_007776 [Sarracenia purpurea var. burkii]
MSLVEDTGIRYIGDAIGISNPSFEMKSSEFIVGDPEGQSAEWESLMDQLEGFAKAWGEIVQGCLGGVNAIIEKYLCITGDMNDTARNTALSSLVITEKQPHWPGATLVCVGIFFTLFNWNQRFAKKKLFSRKLLPSR